MFAWPVVITHSRPEPVFAQLFMIAGVPNRLSKRTEGCLSRDGALSACGARPAISSNIGIPTSVLALLQGRSLFSETACSVPQSGTRQPHLAVPHDVLARFGVMRVRVASAEIGKEAHGIAQSLGRTQTSLLREIAQDMQC